MHINVYPNVHIFTQSYTGTYVYVCVCPYSHGKFLESLKGVIQSDFLWRMKMEFIDFHFFTFYPFVQFKIFMNMYNFYNEIYNKLWLIKLMLLPSSQEKKDPICFTL